MAHPSAGKPLSRDLLINPEKLRARYYSDVPDASVAEQRVAFGTSGHRGSASRRSFNEPHILAVAQALCESWSSSCGCSPADRIVGLARLMFGEHLCYSSRHACSVRQYRVPYLGAHCRG